MNSNPDGDHSATMRSYQVALAIAGICPTATFCTFAVTTRNGKQTKVPYNKNSMGVASDTLDDLLYSSAELRSTKGVIPGGKGAYWGVVMHKPIHDPFGELLLTIIDVDTKSSNAPRDIRLTKLSQLAKDRNMMRELSHSKKGIHIIALAPPDADVVGKYNLGNDQAVEVFGQPKSPKKSVMLTGDELTRAAINEEAADVKNLLAQVNIHKEPKTVWQPITSSPDEPMTSSPSDLSASSPNQLSDYSRALSAIHHLDPDMEHDDWVMVGMALKAGLGDDGFPIWSSWSAQGTKWPGLSELEHKWKSFKKSGVQINTLFGMAQRAGWENPRKGKPKQPPSAHQDFSRYITGVFPPEPTIDEETGEIFDPSGWEEVDYQLNTLQPVDYLVDGFLAHSFAVFAGQPGVGKTTAILSMAMIVMGFKVDGSDCKIKRRRRVIYVSEDTSQVIRSLYGYCKIFGLNAAEIKEWFVLIDSKRSDVDEVLRLAYNVQTHTVGGERPWLIIDTANATLDLENENDNSEVGKYLAALKQLIYTRLATSVCIVTHTSKTTGRGDDSGQARGASAFTGDATLTGVIFIENEQRFLRLTKMRYEPEFVEVRFDTQFHEAMVLDKYGEPQEQRCIVVVPVASSQVIRIAEREQAEEARITQHVADVSDAAVMYVQNIFNSHPEGVAFKKGRGNFGKPENMRNMFELTLKDVYTNVTGANSSADIREAVKEALFRRILLGTVDGWNAFPVKVNG